MKNNIILMLIFISCSSIPKNVRELSQAKNFEGCWIYFDSKNILDEYCSDKKMNSHSQFLIGSLTKMFVAAQLLKLEEQEMMASRDKIVDYMPELEKGQSYQIWKELRLFHLVKHRSGTPNLYDSFVWKEKGFKEQITREDFLKFLIKSPINDQTVGLYHYNNSGYILLGEVLRRKTNKTMSENLKWSFFAPLLMDDTQVGIDPKKFIYNEMSTNTKEMHINDLFCDGNIASSTADLAKWGQHILNRTEIFKENYSYIKYLKPSNDGYAYGFLSYRKANKEFAMHTGGWIGYQSYFILNLTDKKGAVFISHKMDKDSFNEFTDLSVKKFFLSKQVSLH